MTSTAVFYAANSTLTMHMPPGSAEAVLMIEALDSVASITLPLDEVKRLISTLQASADATGVQDRTGVDDLPDPSPISQLREF